MERECKLIILALTKFCFASPGIFSLKGQPGCKWLCIGRRGITDMTRLKHAKFAMGENLVVMNNVPMSEGGIT